MPADNAARRRNIDTLYDKVRRGFAGINEVSVDELPALRRERDVILVDVRTPEEQAVSMIPGAITARAFEANEAEHAGRTVVAYCTIGGRSGRYTQELAARGWDAYNLKGAILAWTHADGPLEDAGGPTRRVHVHGKKFDQVAEGYEPVW
ncbi:MAG: rhodanese-like domain-containing protein [Planctomycetota bacterium]|jgi:sodium/bile acid cotransporter 7